MKTMIIKALVVAGHGLTWSALWQAIRPTQERYQFIEALTDLETEGRIYFHHDTSHDKRHGGLQIQTHFVTLIVLREAPPAIAHSRACTCFDCSTERAGGRR